MSTNVEPEEAEAIREILDEGAEGDSQVASRDFREPRRLSAAALDVISRQLSSIVPDMEQSIASSIGGKWPMSLAQIAETSASGLFDEGEGPYAALRFEAGGQIGWITWDSKSAVRSVETVLGAMGESPKARSLSDVECTVLHGLLAPIADATLRSLDIKADGVAIAQTKEALGDWLDAGDAADPYRLHVEYGIEGPGEASSIHLYLPAPEGKEAPKAKKNNAIHVPSHLDTVEIEARVRIEGCEVSLDQLLDLEEGDVIPLDARIGDPAQLCVDGRVVGRGQLGTHLGHLAIRLEEIEQNHQELG